MTATPPARRWRVDRSLLVLLHRWAGLVMAGFLLMAGLTGALMAWNHELEVALSPELFVAQPPSPGAAMLDPLLLRERVQAAYPQAYVARVPLQVEPGRSVLFRLSALPDAATGVAAALPNDQVFVNPYTGVLQGERKWGDISQGRKNLMSFIYRLHYTLALDKFGTYTMGVIALLWMLDCLVGACLTFPAAQRQPARRLAAVTPGIKSGKPWLLRWWSSWKLRTASGSYKLTFDLHRAGGLWLWAMLFVLAWSGVAFNLSEVHDPVMKTLFAHQADGPALPQLARPERAQAQEWQRARAMGRRLAAGAAQQHGFSVQGEDLLVHDARRGVFRYAVRSSRDILHQGGWTSVVFDARSGAVHSLWLPTGAASGDTIRTWIISLHMALVWGVPFKLFMTLTGLAVAMLSVTGLAIWWRKRQGRMRPAGRSVAAAAARHG